MKRTPIRRKTRLERVSERRRAQMDRRRELVARKRAENPYCEIGQKIYVHTGGAHGHTHDVPFDHLHEPLMRSAGGDPCDEDGTLRVCARCHIWVHTQVAEAMGLGLLVSRYPGRRPH